jgi:hypothetical protein
MYNSIQIYEPEHFGNGWGFYVDIENPHIPIVKHGFVSGKYPRNYYSSNDKIDEELEYYEYEYNKKKEEESKNFEESNIIKTNSSSLLFNISSLTIITAALSYCFLAAL